MISRRLLSLLLTTVGYATAASLPYQGILTDEKGVPVPDGEKSIAFDVYGQSAGGSALWSEVRTVTTRKGLFSLSLGTVTPLPDALFARDSLFLNVAVSGTSQVPRTPLGTSPWAFRARNADVAQFAKDVPGLGAKLDTGIFNSRLSAYAPTSALAGYAKTSDLTSYAKAADLSAYAKTATLAGYATTAALSSVTTSVGAKLDSTRAVKFDAYGKVKLPDTSSLEIARDPNTGWGTSLSSVWGLSIYSGGDNGSFSLRKSDSTYGVVLRASNRGGTYDIIKTDGRDVAFAGNMAIAGGVKLPTASTIQIDRDPVTGWGTSLSSVWGLSIYSGGDDGSFSLRKSDSTYGVALRASNRGGTYDIFKTDGRDVKFAGNMAIAGGVKLPTASTIQIDRDPVTGWGTSLSSVWGLSIYSGGDDGSFSLRKSDSTYGVALRASNRGGTYDIFNTDGRDVNFAGNMAIAGGVKLPATSTIQFDRDATIGWGTEVSATGLHIYSGGDNGSFSLVKSADTYGVALHVANRGGAYDILKTDGHNVDFSGNVVIAGSLKAKATVVVPDYVFEPDYKLAPLAEVETYIAANKHLPEIPSAKEIEAGGVDLAQMNLLLLKKIEELTLHAIAQEKRIQALEERTK